MDFSQIHPAAAAGYAEQAHTMERRMDTRLVQITVTEAEEILRQLQTATADLCNAIAQDVEARRMLKDAEADLSAAEAEIVAEANIAAINKTGPLSGIATTSKAYAYALDNLLHNSHSTQQSRATIRRLQAQADNASIDLQQAQIRFAATKHAADLKAAILRAITL